ncbi:hypothetical protein OE88DRAFT_1740453 [Heliocybe sulcata]|uniref:Aminoglycoside phosphotransferase domain-containing protein n=1 Tax=Heliocybe sulcata TaxID=5364 RepID=A0A5C3MLT0_9AGAM|nr:hypothetical protein OE88DRAFT_1740453 [Heliocybe sulcata]
MDSHRRYTPFNQFNTVHRTLFGLVIKKNASPSEYAATEFVRRNANIPVPFVYDYIKMSDTFAYLVMQRMPSMSLDDYRINIARPTAEQQAVLADHLRVIAEVLKQVQSPYGQSICSFGPFPSLDNFHRALLQYSHLQIPDGEERLVIGKINAAILQPFDVRLTHDDLTPANILVDKDLNITCVLDWATASWMSEYW